MITGLKLRNFKAIGDRPVELQLAPLTLLVGANGSGKSSVLEAVGGLAETAAQTASIRASRTAGWSQFLTLGLLRRMAAKEPFGAAAIAPRKRSIAQLGFASTGIAAF